MQRRGADICSFAGVISLLYGSTKRTRGNYCARRGLIRARPAPARGRRGGAGVWCARIYLKRMHQFVKRDFLNNCTPYRGKFSKCEWTRRSRLGSVSGARPGSGCGGKWVARSEIERTISVYEATGEIVDFGIFGVEN
ncbi:hypothetical protein EVAR_16493_1 [Eumeta japonica]|uniref:Uncharacterized protein n=1 Tax=Eumeta variegata TaxID=151549 RepID=A0A4C1UKD3_EUMVA|nr:hypothetical protein EVAR_16493_1 [Eumeta japonica]